MIVFKLFCLLFWFLWLPFWLSTHIYIQIYLLILYFLKTHYASIPCLDQFWWWWRNIKIIIMKRCLKFIAQFTSLMCFCSDIYYYTCLNIYNIIYFMRFFFLFSFFSTSLLENSINTYNNFAETVIASYAEDMFHVLHSIWSNLLQRFCGFF